MSALHTHTHYIMRKWKPGGLAVLTLSPNVSGPSRPAVWSDRGAPAWGSRGLNFQGDSAGFLAGPQRKPWSSWVWTQASETPSTLGGIARLRLEAHDKQAAGSPFTPHFTLLSDSCPHFPEPPFPGSSEADPPTPLGRVLVLLIEVKQCQNAALCCWFYYFTFFICRHSGVD